MQSMNRKQHSYQQISINKPEIIIFQVNLNISMEQVFHQVYPLAVIDFAEQCLSLELLLCIDSLYLTKLKVKAIHIFLITQILYLRSEMFIQTKEINMKIILVQIAILIIGINCNLREDIKTVNQRLTKQFWQLDQKFILGIQAKHTRGLYESQVHLNIADKKNSLQTALFRQKFQIPDQNMFVTSFVLYGLLQANQLQTIELDHHRFSLSLEALSQFRDKNTNYGLPQYVFWLQQQISGIWSAQSGNLDGIINSIPNVSPKMAKFLDKIGLGILSFAKSFKTVFCIPADVDDSSVNLVLLGYLDELKSQHLTYWKSINFDTQRFYDEIVSKYVYRPFDESQIYPLSNEIDPRSYYVLHNFLKKRKEEAIAKGQKPRVILPTTWILNYDEQVKDILKMPFSMNNIDASVNANFLFGLIYQVKSNNVHLNGELKQMIKDITDMLVFVVQQVVTVRPDILLLYYPSKYDFYWFIARTLCLLERMDKHQQVLAYSYERLSLLMRNQATNQLLQQMKIQQTDKSSYWVEFLGNFAGKNRNEDALFSTSLALNALLDIWGSKSGNSFKLLSNTPSTVKTAINQGIVYLQKHLNSKNSKTGNVFFSGSIKTFTDDYPYIFPGNLIIDSNNKTVNAQTAKLEESNHLNKDCVKGYIEDEVYQQMLKQKWFQLNVPTKFDGYNIQGSFFPYWSSSSITEVMMITAFSKYLRATETNLQKS